MNFFSEHLCFLVGAQVCLLLRAATAVDMSAAVFVCHPLSSAQVAYMHSKQIIHRDLKGANLLISNAG